MILTHDSWVTRVKMPQSEWNRSFVFLAYRVVMIFILFTKLEQFWKKLGVIYNFEQFYGPIIVKNGNMGFKFSEITGHAEFSKTTIWISLKWTEKG